MDRFCGARDFGAICGATLMLVHVIAIVATLSSCNGMCCPEVSAVACGGIFALVGSAVGVPLCGTTELERHHRKENEPNEIASFLGFFERPWWLVCDPVGPRAGNRLAFW